MFKSFKKTPVDIHMLVTDQGQEKYVEIDTDTTMRDASGKINEIAFGLTNGKVNEVEGGIEATGYTPDGRKVVIAAYEQSAFKAGNIDY